jgi:hypothetical protein
METDIGRELIRHFFHAPQVEALLVFEDNEYFGIVLKKDIEMSLVKKGFELGGNINRVKPAQLPLLLFRGEPGKTTRIPVIDKTGRLQRIISYEEYESQFDTDAYLPHFKPSSTLEGLAHPVVVTNHFRRILYANRRAMETAGMDLPGKPFSALLRLFEIRSLSRRMLIEKGEAHFELLITSSDFKGFSSFLYQFLPVETENH